MRSDDYLRLCERLDDILLGTPVTEARLSVSVLHMVRNHPQFTDLYAPLFRPGGDAGDTLRYFADRAKALAIIGAHLGRVAANRVTARRSGPPIPRCEVLLVSYLFAAKNAEDPDDMYFGRLADAMRERGYATRTLRFDSTPGIQNVNRTRPGGGHVHVLDRFVSLAREWRHVRMLWRESIAQRRAAAPDRDAVARRLPRFLSNRALSMWSLLNLRRVQLVADAVAQARPRLLVTTYEGLPWERMLYARARHLVPGIRCVGYQQAPVFRNQHAIRRPLGRPFDPDVILTSSAHSRRQLLTSAGYPETRIDVLGSKRYAGGVLAPARDLTGGRLGVLVVPEGLVGECAKLFGLAKAAAALLPECTFIWRLHPQLGFAQLRRRLPALFADMPANVILSTEDLAVDIARSHLALYRASSAIITCINGGLWPVYVNVDDAEDLDPLYDLEGTIPSIQSAEALAALVRQAGRDGAMPGAGDNSPVRACAAAYYDPLEPAALAACIEDLPRR